jgi:hypothetical protein
MMNDKIPLRLLFLSIWRKRRKELNQISEKQKGAYGDDLASFIFSPNGNLQPTELHKCELRNIVESFLVFKSRGFAIK